MNKEYLDYTQKRIIEAANNNGVDLSEHFSSDDEFKQHVIAIAIQNVRGFCGFHESTNMKFAYDYVLGKGSFDKLLNESFDDMRKDIK
jgi:hypothetical protein